MSSLDLTSPLLDYIRRARWPFRAFCVDGLPQNTSYCCNYIKLAEIGNRTVTDSLFHGFCSKTRKFLHFTVHKQVDHGKRDRQTDRRTDRQTDGRTNIKFWGPSTQKALKGNKIEYISQRQFTECAESIHLTENHPVAS